MYEDLSLEHFMSGLEKRNPGEPEFHQAQQRTLLGETITFLFTKPLRINTWVKLVKA